MVNLSAETPLPGRHHAEDKSRFTNNMRSRTADSDLTTYVAANLDAGTSAGSRSSSVTSFFKRTVHRIRRPSGESDTRSDAMRNGGQKGDNADVRLKGARLARPVLLDLKQEAGSVSFQKASTVPDMEARLKIAKKLHDDAVDLKMFYESRTVANMQDLRATGKAVPYCLKNQTTQTFDFQESPAHFHRTVPYSARWTLCWLRFNDFTKN